MKNILVFLLIGLLTQNVSAQNDAYFTKTAAIDGLSTEWSKDLLNFDRETAFTTAVRNDTENLYILFQTDDQMAIDKLLAAGMEVSFKAKTKPKLNAKLKFPLVTEEDNAGDSSEKRVLSEGVDAAVLLKANRELQVRSKKEAQLNGFDAGNGRKSLIDLEGIEMALAIDETVEKPVFSYELKIALSKLYGPNSNWDKVYKTALMINITVKGIEIPFKTDDYVKTGGAINNRSKERGVPAGVEKPEAYQYKLKDSKYMTRDQNVKLKYALSR
ncbi:hypothetical protein [Roseivirga misakiensis]|uniref:Uncharacterized protein n=1 Tax=Roseivirga misakiensis TaxID=1563681 RepID=A0A1E5T5F2_9BACT|nr:hypothetical protein [Roseivirga misakiensis]OEK06576.1 hypothetical protein BFP71_02575 [Roseivirga misakiensis]